MVEGVWVEKTANNMVLEALDFVLHVLRVLRVRRAFCLPVTTKSIWIEPSPDGLVYAPTHFAKLGLEMLLQRRSPCGLYSPAGALAGKCSSNLACKHRPCYFGCFKGASKSVQVMSSGIQAVMVLILKILKYGVPKHLETVGDVLPRVYKIMVQTGKDGL